MIPWKPLPAEWRARKWTAWCSHCGWGAAICLGAALCLGHGWAIVLSVAAGLAWELGYWWLSPGRLEDRPSVLDWLAWGLGAVIGWGWMLVVAVTRTQTGGP